MTLLRFPKWHIVVLVVKVWVIFWLSTPCITLTNRYYKLINFIFLERIEGLGPNTIHKISWPPVRPTTTISPAKPIDSCIPKKQCTIKFGLITRPFDTIRSWWRLRTNHQCWIFFEVGCLESWNSTVWWNNKYSVLNMKWWFYNKVY